MKSTKQYELFKIHENNRQLDYGNLKKIKNSIKTKNLLNFRPILVDGDMQVIDGQHRLQAAKELGLDIFYEMDKKSDVMDIVLLNANQKDWTLQNFISHYASIGKKEYISFEKYCDDNKYNKREVLSYMRRYYPRISERIKNGSFSFMDQDRIIEHRKYMGKLSIFSQNFANFKNTSFVNTSRFKMALESLLSHDEVNVDVLIMKIRMNSDKFCVCATWAAYYMMLVNLYNYKNPYPFKK